MSTNTHKRHFIEIVLLIIVVALISFAAFFDVRSLFGFGDALVMRETTQKVEQLDKSSVPTKSISISSCKSLPLNVKASLKDTITFSNMDDVKHIITITASSSFVLKPKASYKQDLSVVKYPGIYTYMCDANMGAGVLYITK